MRTTVFENTREIYSREDVNFHPTLLNSTSPRTEHHWHDCYEILMITEGTLIYDHQGIQLPASVGDILCINPNDIHSLFLPPDCHTAWHDCLHVQSSLIEKLGIPVKGVRLFPLVRHTMLGEYYQRVVAALRQKNIPNPAIHQIRVHSEALALFGMLFENYSYIPDNQANFSEDSIDVIKRLLSYIQSHLNEPLTLDILSKEVNFSKPYICRIVRNHMNTTIVEMINHQRCQYAQSLLLREGIPINECASRAGFNTLSYFSKVYYEHIGELPSVTRKKSHLYK